jgi:hypothetical protein
MACRRLEDGGLLAEAGDELERHLEHCPDCQAKMATYERIAGWIAQGGTAHRAPPDWERRTLALLDAAPIAPPSDPAPADGVPADELVSSAGPAVSDVPAERATHAMVIHTTTPAALRTTPSETTGVSLRPARARPRRDWYRAVAPFVAVTIAAVTVAALLCRARVTPVPDQRSAVPTAATRSQMAAQSPTGAGHQEPPTSFEADDCGDSPCLKRDPSRPVGETPQRHTESEGPLVEIVIDSKPPFAEVLLDGFPAGRTPVRIPLPRDRRVKLVIRSIGYVDHTLFVDTSSSVRAFVVLVPLSATATPPK